MTDRAASLAGAAARSAAYIERWEHILAELPEADAADRERWRDLIDHHLAAIGDVEALLPDTDLLREYQAINGENHQAEALLAEIKRRQLDF